MLHGRRYFLRYGFGLTLILGIFLGFILLEINVIVRQKFEGQRWRSPSTIYARALEFTVGSTLREEDLVRELQELRYKQVDRLKLPGDYQKESGSYTIYRRAFMFPEGAEGAVKIRIQLSGNQVTAVESNGKAAARVRLEPLKMGSIYPSQKEDRKLVQLKQVPTHLINSILAIEDKDFYQHLGISPRAISRAMLNNFKAGRLVEGASTITQQLVKNSYLTHERSIKRKLLEALYSIILELHYSKDEILEAYINEIYLGQDGDKAIHGFGLASEFYFGRPIEHLSLDQAALLAAMVNGPSFYHPLRHPERCEKRRNRILKTLYKQKKISKKAYQVARRQKIKSSARLPATAGRYPAYLDLVRRNLQHDYGAWDLTQEGLRIFTAFDPHIQWQSEAAVADFVQSQGKNGERLQVASVVVSEIGEVQSLIGNKVPNFQGFNRALDARRSIGSLAKPAVILAALSDPARYSLSTVVSDDPIRVPVATGRYWSPKNLDYGSHGQVSLLTMLSKSYNQAAVRLGMQLGIHRVRETFAKLTGKENIPDAPSIILGSMSMSPFEVAGMYYTIFSQGNRTELKAIQTVQNAKGEFLTSYVSPMKQVFEPEVMQNLHQALRSVIVAGTAHAVLDYIPLERYAAGKTGTSNKNRDSWFAGFTKNKLAVTWVGNDYNQPTYLTGSNGGLTLWAKIMAGINRQPAAPAVAMASKILNKSSPQFSFVQGEVKASR